MPRHLPLLQMLLIVSSAACASGKDTPPAADTSSTPAATASTPTPPVGEWRVSEEGFGPLHAGMTIAQAAAVVPGSFVSPSGNVANECEYASWSEAPAGVHVMLSSGTVARIDVDSQSVVTVAGAGVGNSEARIDSLYPGRVRRMPHKYEPRGAYLVVLAQAPADTINRMVFETDGLQVKTYRVGRTPQVEYVERCG